MRNSNVLKAIPLVLLSCDSATAALSTASHPIFGSHSLTQDTQQALYWLTPNETVGLSFAEVVDLLANDIRFQGFRVASTEELATLYTQANIQDINVAGYGALYGTTENVPGGQYLQSLIGITYSTQVSGQTITETAGFVGSTFISPINGFWSVNIGNVAIRENVPTSSGPMSFASAYTEWGSVPIGTNYVGVGTWLVSSIPEPSQYIYFVLGALSFGILRRRIGA